MPIPNTVGACIAPPTLHCWMGVAVEAEMSPPGMRPDELEGNVELEGLDDVVPWAIMDNDAVCPNGRVWPPLEDVTAA